MHCDLWFVKVFIFICIYTLCKGCVAIGKTGYIFTYIIEYIMETIEIFLLVWKWMPSWVTFFTYFDITGVCWLEKKCRVFFNLFHTLIQIFVHGVFLVKRRYEFLRVVLSNFANCTFFCHNFSSLASEFWHPGVSFLESVGLKAHF